MKDANIVNIINMVKKSNWVEKNPVNVSLSHIPDNAEEKILRKISLGSFQKLEITLRNKKVFIKHICYCEDEDKLYAEVYIKTVYNENRIIPFSDLKNKHIIMITEKLFNPVLPDPDGFSIGYLLSDFMIKKYKLYKNRVKTIRKHFIFLNDGTFIYDYEEFDDHLQAIAAACRYGENPKELISLIYPEERDQDPIYQKYLNLSNQKYLDLNIC